MLEDLLKQCPVLYVQHDEEDGEDTLTLTPPEDYDYSIGVTLDYIPEDKEWVGSYADYLESRACDTPNEAIEDLIEQIHKNVK